MRKLCVLAVLLVSCTAATEPAPEPKPVTKTVGSSDNELPDGDPGPGACDHQDIVVIGGRRIRLPALCNPYYFYDGDPPPDEFFIDYAIPEGR